MPRDQLHSITTHTREARALSHALRLLLHHEHPAIVALREGYLTSSERQLNVLKSCAKTSVVNAIVRAASIVPSCPKRPPASL